MLKCPYILDQIVSYESPDHVKLMKYKNYLYILRQIHDFMAKTLVFRGTDLNRYKVTRFFHKYT
jgi:hypothetical protein